MRRREIIGAAFLMATSAIGPGFLTQTTVFTRDLGADFGFVILAAIVLDLIVQYNIWRVLVLEGKTAGEVADGVLPGLGKGLTALIVFGGLAFNTGNLAGCGLGLYSLAGIPIAWGAAFAALTCLVLLVAPSAARLLDWGATVMGIAMIGAMIWVLGVQPPDIEVAVQHSLLPAHVNLLALLTIVGGTVGGYICFAGGHRLVQAGYKGESSIPYAMRSATLGIGAASVMRLLLFLAALGVLHGGHSLLGENPPALIFEAALGTWGRRIFGLVMLFAAITSVLGSAYTSISFVSGSFPRSKPYEAWMVSAFLVVSLATFLIFGRPVRLLILAGAVNGFILPLSLGLMLWVARKRKAKIPAPQWLWWAGLGVALLFAVIAVRQIIA